MTCEITDGMVDVTLDCIVQLYIQLGITHLLTFCLVVAVLGYFVRLVFGK